MSIESHLVGSFGHPMVGAFVYAGKYGDRRLWDVALSSYHLPALIVADELGVFEMIHQRSASATDVSGRCLLDLRGTESLLNLLSALGFVEEKDDKFYPTALSKQFLDRSSNYYWGPMLSLFRGGLCDLILRCLRQESKERAVLNVGWTSGRLDLKQVRDFTDAMQSHSISAATLLAANGCFDGVTRLLDVGGGSGCFSIALTQQYPELQCSVMDLPEVCERADEYISRFGMQSRIETLRRDMFSEPWPHAHDAVLLSDILHCWGREKRTQLVKKCFDNLPAGGRLFVHEMLKDGCKDQLLAAASYSMAMFLVTNGEQFTPQQIRGLLCECGFESVSVTPSGGYHSLVVARKPDK